MMPRAMSRVLLIGGAGFIGAHLTRALLDDGHDAIVFDDGRDAVPGEEATRAREWRRRELLAGATCFAGDAADRARLSDVMLATAPDAVVHLANLPLADVAAREPARARRTIVGVTAAVLDVVGEHAPAAALTYVSSSMVYGDFVGEPQPEDAPLRPRDHYGRYKLAAEELVRASGLDWRIVRPSAVYGPGDGNARFVQRLIAAALAGEPFALTADPATRLDFTWVGDLARGLAAAALLDVARHGTFNVTTGCAHSLGDAIAAVRDCGLAVEVHEAPVCAPHEPRRGSLDITRARTILGFAPELDLAAGLAEYLRWAGALAPVG
jgi:UDP-glucose 4-epimerase